MANIEKRKWYLRKSRMGGYNYLFYKYSANRHVRIVHDPSNWAYYIVEMHFSGKNKSIVPLFNPSTKTNQFTSPELAFKAANKMIEEWDKPLGQDNRLVNPAFERFAAENGIDSWPSLA